MRILELENRCTGNRTVGSNPTLSANLSFGADSAAAAVHFELRLPEVRGRTDALLVDIVTDCEH